MSEVPRSVVIRYTSIDKRKKNRLFIESCGLRVPVVVFILT